MGRWPEGATLLTRFESKYEPVPFCGCWLWTASTNSKGYGTIAVAKNKTEMAHRVAYQLFVGEIPQGKTVLHRCDTPCCVNPDHLFLGTRADNSLDMNVKGRGRPSSLGLPKGVHKVRNKYAVRFTRYGKTVGAGRLFDEAEEAGDFYRRLAGKVKEMVDGH